MVISGVNTVTYNGDGITTTWPYTFPVTDDSEIRVQLNNADGTAVLIDSDYYVDLVNSTVLYPGYAPGAEPPEADQPPKVQEGQTITVYREIPMTQEADLGEKWPFEVIAKGLDKLTMIAQQIDSGTKRMLDNALASMELLADVVVDSGELQHITDQLNEIDEKAEDAADSADAAADSESNALSYKNAAAGSATDAATSEANAQTILNAILNSYGYPFTAATVADMTDITKIYVYVGSEAGYTAGDWYYYNGNAWVSGGSFTSLVSVDPTLTVNGAAADAKVTGDKFDLIEPLVVDSLASTNVVTPNRTQLYPAGNGSLTINSDLSITFDNVPRAVTAWVFFSPNGTPITLEAGDYTICIDDGLYNYVANVMTLDAKVSGGSWTKVVSITGTQTSFTLENDTTAEFRIGYYASGLDYITNWTGHYWINKGGAQKYMPVGYIEYTPKDLVEEDELAEVRDNAISKEIYRYGNLVDYSKVTNGYIGANGEVVPYNTLWVSDYCEIQEGTIYQNGAVYGQYFAFYDEDKVLVASYDTLGSMHKLSEHSTVFYIAVPAGSKYFRCTFTTDQSVNKSAWVSNIPEKPYNEKFYNVDNVYPYTINPTNPCEYSELTVRAFSKVVCIGDSLTYGGFNMSDSSTPSGETQSPAELSVRYSYPSNFQRITGIDTTNKGDSGETSVSWYQKHGNEDFSEFDLAIVMLGVNDSAFSVSDADTLTAMQNIVNMLKTARSDMRIAICSTMPLYENAGYQHKGQLILNWAIGLNDPNIIPLDLSVYSHVRPYTSYGAGHCSALGYYMLALDISRYISWYMDNHLRDFRFIHFIGSPDAQWTFD